jgi:hypothetical protein
MTMIFFAAHQKRQDTNNREREMTDQEIDQVIQQAIDPSASHHARVALIPMLVAAIRAQQCEQTECETAHLLRTEANRVALMASIKELDE